MRFPVRARTLQQLSDMAEPTVGAGGNPAGAAWTVASAALPDFPGGRGPLAAQVHARCDVGSPSAAAR